MGLKEGEGWLHSKIESGKWQERVSKDGKDSRICTFRTNKEAEIEAQKVEERINYEQSLNYTNMLFDEVAKEWLFEHNL